MRRRLRPLPDPRRLRHELARMHRQSISASPCGGHRFRAAPWWLAALGAADGAAAAINTAEPLRSGTLAGPTATLPAPFSHRQPSS